MKKLLLIASLAAGAIYLYKKSTEIRQYGKTNEKGSTAILAGNHMASYLNQNVNYISSGVTPRTNKRNYLITNSDDELLVDIYGNTIISDKDVKVYANGELI